MEYIGREGAESARYLLEHLENHQFALKIKFYFLAVMSREMSQKNCQIFKLLCGVSNTVRKLITSNTFTFKR